MDVVEKFLVYFLGNIYTVCKNCGFEYYIPSEVRARERQIVVRPGPLKKIECPKCGMKELYLR